MKELFFHSAYNHYWEQPCEKCVKYPVKQKLILANLLNIFHPCEKLCETFEMILE